MARPLDLGLTAPTPADARLLVAALAPADLAASAWHEWRRTTTVEDSATRLHALLPLVSARLPDDVLGDDAAKLSGLRRRAWAVGEQLRARLASVRALLDEAGAGPRPVRGSAFLDEPGPLPRPVDRLDVLVRPAAWADALAVLAADGWHTAVARSRSEAGITLADASGTRLRVSWAPAFPGLLRRPLPEASVVEPSGRLLVAILEGLRPPGGSPLLWPVDAQVLATRMEASSWDELVRLAGDAGVSPIPGAALRWMAEQIGTPVPTPVLAALDTGPLDARLARRFASYAAGNADADRVGRRLDITRTARSLGVDIGLGAMDHGVTRLRRILRTPAAGAGPSPS